MATSFTVPLRAEILKVSEKSLGQGGEETPFFVITLDLGDELITLWIKKVTWITDFRAIPEKGDVYSGLVRISVKTRGGYNGEPQQVFNQLKFTHVSPLVESDGE